MIAIDLSSDCSPSAGHVILYLYAVCVLAICVGALGLNEARASVLRIFDQNPRLREAPSKSAEVQVVGVGLGHRRCQQGSLCVGGWFQNCRILFAKSPAGAFVPSRRLQAFSVAACQPPAIIQKICSIHAGRRSSAPRCFVLCHIAGLFSYCRVLPVGLSNKVSSYASLCTPTDER